MRNESANTALIRRELESVFMVDYKVLFDSQFLQTDWIVRHVPPTTWEAISTDSYALELEMRHLAAMKAFYFQNPYFSGHKILRTYTRENKLFKYYLLSPELPILKEHSNFLHSQGYCDVSGTVYVQGQCEIKDASRKRELFQ